MAKTAYKGCINENCNACKKKRHFPTKTNKCPECKQQLVYVCMECHMKLPNDSHRYCKRCYAKQEDKKHNIGNVLAAGGVALLGCAGLVVKIVTGQKDK